MEKISTLYRCTGRSLQTPRGTRTAVATSNFDNYIIVNFHQRNVKAIHIFSLLGFIELCF